MTKTAKTGALDGVWVLEISALAASVAGRVLADLGAEVVKIEPEGGEAGRYGGSQARAEPGAETATWLAYNFNKKSVVIDLATSQGEAQFAALARNAQIVLTDFQRLPLAEMDRLGAIARAANPALIWTEILPFGRGHAHEMKPATDTTLQALGGHLFQNGDADRPPVRIGLPVALTQAGAEAANAALMAYYHALRTGEGQRVDISAQEVIIWTLLNTTMAWQILGLNEMRGGAIRKERSNRFFTRLVWPCRDGYFVFGPVGGGGGAARAKSYEALVAWMAEDGITDAILSRHDWNGNAQFAIPQADYDEVTAVIKGFIETKTTEVLIARSIHDRILMAPISSFDDILTNVQFRKRGLFKPLVDASRGLDVELPAKWVHMSANEVARMVSAPEVGADTETLLRAIPTLEEVS